MGIPPGQNPILYIRNLPYSVTSTELQALFDKFGPLRQVRIGNAKDTKGSAFVIFGDPAHAKTALQKMTGYAVQGRYLIIGFWQPGKEGKFGKKRTVESTPSSSSNVPKTPRIDEEPQ